MCQLKIRLLDLLKEFIAKTVNLTFVDNVHFEVKYHSFIIPLCYVNTKITFLNDDHIYEALINIFSFNLLMCMRLIATAAGTSYIKL